MQGGRSPPAVVSARSFSGAPLWWVRAPGRMSTASEVSGACMSMTVARTSASEAMAPCHSMMTMGWRHLGQRQLAYDPASILVTQDRQVSRWPQSYSVKTASRSMHTMHVMARVGAL